MICRKSIGLLLAAVLAATTSAVTVEVDSDCAGMGSVTSSEKVFTNGTSRLTLRASAADGNAFSGWTVNGEVVAWTDDLRYPGTLTATVASNAVVTAEFVRNADDRLEFDISDLLGDVLTVGETVSETLWVDSSSFPSVTFKGLPKGLSYDERTLTVFGAPTEPGLYEIEANGVNASGFTFRSLATVRVANIEGPRVVGEDSWIQVGEYFFSEIGDDDPSDIFSFSESPTSVSLSGAVPGLEWRDDWQLLFGTPTEAGEYTLTVTASFPTGAVERASLSLLVMGEDPAEYGIDLDGLDCLRCGDVIETGAVVIGPSSGDIVIRGVSGLPTGLSATSWSDSGVRTWGVTGTVCVAGRFTVAVDLLDYSGSAQRALTVSRRVDVDDISDVYLDVTSSDASRGTVSGGGAVSPAVQSVLTAVPLTGNVFAGWYDAGGERLVMVDGVDYRNPTVTIPAGTDLSFFSAVAQFAAKSADVAPSIPELEYADLLFAPDEFFEFSFSVESLSLPTLTFKNLPRGMSCSAVGDGDFALTYDPSVAEAASARYPVVLTAVNASGQKSSFSFRITVGNRTDSRIGVEDDYGEFTPGEEIDPIDLSSAVDFERGETLSVSGLPRGLVYNQRDNGRTGAAAYTITGTPTAPGDYTLSFSAKVVSGESTNRQGNVSYSYVTVKATSFMTVLPYPELVIDVDEDAASAGCKVNGAGNYKPETKVSLKATAAKGWVFSGWEGIDDLEGLAALSPSVSFVSGDDDMWALAGFTTIDQDRLYLDSPEPTAEGYAAEWPLKEDIGEFDAYLVYDLIDTVSWPTVKVSGLPAGVKFSSSTFLLSGAPTKSGVYHVTVTAKNAGGYSFVRVFDIAVLNADGSMPSEKSLENSAEIDFSPLDQLMTGVYCPTGAVVLAAGAKPGSGAAVKKVAVSGIPAGLASETTMAGGGATIEFVGTPTKPGRFVITVSVTYVDGKTLKSQAAVVVEDGGSEYLFVSSGDPDAGSVSGEGVYASGATVRLSARPKTRQVFAGWQAIGEDGGLDLFAPLRDLDDVDPRTASVSFPFRPLDFFGEYELTGAFVASTNDPAAVIEIESETWNIDPSVKSTFAFAVDSMSVPKVTVSGLPKGVTVDAVRGLLVFSPTASTAPGIYTATISAKNVSQKLATSRTVEIKVANRVSEVIGGLDPDMEAYPVSVGTTLDPALITPVADDGWSLSAKGLPSGLSFKNGVVSGVPSRAGDYTVTFTATTGTGNAKQTETATITIRVSALPNELCGTFTGVLLGQGPVQGEGSSGYAVITGTVEITASSAGKISISAKTAAKSYNFTAKSWDVFTNGVAGVEVQNRDGSRMRLSVESTDDWHAWQADGMLVDGDMSLAFSAQRNPFGTQNGVAEARAQAALMAGKTTIDCWKVTIAARGTVNFAGNYEGKSLSGSAVLQSRESDGGQDLASETPDLLQYEYFARYVKFIDKKSLFIITFTIEETGEITDWSVEKR